MRNRRPSFWTRLLAAALSTTLITPGMSYGMFGLMEQDPLTIFVNGKKVPLDGPTVEVDAKQAATAAKVLGRLKKAIQTEVDRTAKLIKKHPHQDWKVTQPEITAKETAKGIKLSYEVPEYITTYNPAIGRDHKKYMSLLTFASYDFDGSQLTVHHPQKRGKPIPSSRLGKLASALGFTYIVDKKFDDEGMITELTVRNTDPLTYTSERLTQLESSKICINQNLGFLKQGKLSTLMAKQMGLYTPTEQEQQQSQEQATMEPMGKSKAKDVLCIVGIILIIPIFVALFVLKCLAAGNTRSYSRTTYSRTSFFGSSRTTYYHRSSSWW